MTIGHGKAHVEASPQHIRHISVNQLVKLPEPILDSREALVAAQPHHILDMMHRLVVANLWIEFRSRHPDASDEVRIALGEPCRETSTVIPADDNDAGVGVGRVCGAETKDEMSEVLEGLVDCQEAKAVGCELFGDDLGMKFFKFLGYILKFCCCFLNY
jgi:hypothetical protein